MVSILTCVGHAVAFKDLALVLHAYVRNKIHSACHRSSFPDNAVELDAERVTTRSLCEMAQVRGMIFRLFRLFDSSRIVMSGEYPTKGYVLYLVMTAC